MKFSPFFQNFSVFFGFSNLSSIGFSGLSFFTQSVYYQLVFLFFTFLYILYCILLLFLHVSNNCFSSFKYYISLHINSYNWDSCYNISYIEESQLELIIVINIILFLSFFYLFFCLILIEIFYFLIYFGIFRLYKYWRYFIKK